ncbi:MAG: hypothetical protein WD830_02075 [Chloroflexota bacterium]
MSEPRRLDDDQLAAELERRSRSVSLSRDWSRQDLLPAVSAAIDTRPQRVTASRAPAFAGLAAAAAILVVLVVAVPRISPGQPSSSASPPPNGARVLTAAEFAAQVSAGVLNGKTVLVDGAIRRYDAPGILYGFNCWQEYMFPKDAPPGGDCVLGRLDVPGETIWVNAPYVETLNSLRPIRAEPGDWSWQAPQPPIEGRLVLSVSTAGFIEYLGTVLPSSADAISVEAANQIDIDSLSPEDVILVEGWLWSVEGSGREIFIDCRAPSSSPIPGLPNNYCQPRDSLVSERPSAEGLSRGGAHLPVQRGAARTFGVHTDDRAHVFAVAPRLYGVCFEVAPCWQWEVVGRVSTGPTVAPTPTDPVPTPAVLPITHTCGPIASLDPSQQDQSLAWGRHTVVDETGLIERCEGSSAPTTDVAPLTVSNLGQDQTVLVVHWASVCEISGRFTFRRNQTAFELLAESDLPLNTLCDGLPVEHSLLLYMREPTAADKVDMQVIRVGTDLPTATPTPTLTPVSRMIECPVDPTSGEPDLAPKVSLSDHTGLVGDCSAFAGTPEFMIVDWSKPTVRNSGTSQLQVIWRGTVCDHQANVLVSRHPDALSIDVNLADEYASCDNPSAGYLVLNMLKPIDAGTVTASISRASDSPDPNPPPDAPATGDPVLAGQTVACPYSDPVGRPTEVSIVDHAGLVIRCEASISSETPAEQISLANAADDPATLTLAWQVAAICSSMPARVDLWPPPEGTREHPQGPKYALHLDVLDPVAGEIQGCRDVVGTQQLRLFLNEPLSAERVDALITHGMSGTDSQLTAAGTFTLTVFARAAEYAVDEPIDVHAELVYEGPARSAVVTGVGELVNGFGVRQLDGPISIGPGWNEPCIRDSLTNGVELVEPYRKSGGWSEDDPLRDFYMSFFADPELRLPAGTWAITAYSEFYSGECGGELVKLTASVVIEVRGTN